MVKINKWYLAEDKYGGDQYYNYFYVLNDNEVKYLSVQMSSQNNGKFYIEYTVQEYEDFLDSIIDNYELKEIHSPIKKCIKDIFK